MAEDRGQIALSEWPFLTKELSQKTKAMSLSLSYIVVPFWMSVPGARVYGIRNT